MRVIKVSKSWRSALIIASVFLIKYDAIIRLPSGPCFPNVLSARINFEQQYINVFSTIAMRKPSHNEHNPIHRTWNTVHWCMGRWRWEIFCRKGHERLKWNSKTPSLHPEFHSNDELVSYDNLVRVTAGILSENIRLDDRMLLFFIKINWYATVKWHQRNKCHKAHPYSKKLSAGCWPLGLAYLP